MASQTPDYNPNNVSANPAKGFFVSMLIKDITLRDAIGDLVDNAVDAIKSKAADPKSLKGYTINIKLGKTYFSITDNGFGMESDIARNTAFNFGKADQHILIDHSIGQFGIGMKRAFFKIGQNIHVKSTAKTSKFELNINVPEWLIDTNPSWRFEFTKDSLQEGMSNSPSETGFYVKITELSDDSVVSFNDPTFIDKLRKEIQYEHMLNINKGLSIIIEGHELQATDIDLVYNDDIKPTYWDKIEEGKSVKILAGISQKDDEEGGWYIFCNDRLIIAKNKTDETVWTGNKGDGVPLWHAQYHRFRGYVFFEAKDSSMLPWNTTKTGMDQDSPYYKLVRSKMITMTRQVMDLMDKLKTEKEKGNPKEYQTLNMAVDNSESHTVSVTKILEDSSDLSDKFQYPSKLFNPLRGSNKVRIAYQVPKEKYNKVKDELDVSTAGEVGLRTFEYYFKNEL